MGRNRELMGLLAFSVALAVTATIFVLRTPAAPPAADNREQARPATPAPAPAPEPVPAIVKATPAAPAPEPPRAQDPEKGDEPNPRLMVAPVQEEDVALDGKTAERPDFVAPIQGGGFIFERRDTDGKRIGGVVVPGMILKNQGMVELFGCGEGGKEHETIARLECGVQSLDLALTSAGFKRGRLPARTDINLGAQGSRVLIFLQWVDKEGKLVTHRSEDLIVSVRRNSPMPRVGWTYVGQWMEVPDATSPKGEKKDKVLAAANTRSYVTTFRDRSALLDNPLEEAVDDTLFAANYMLLPRGGTPVRVIFRAPTVAERKDIELLEKDLIKNRIEFKEDDREKKEK